MSVLGQKRKCMDQEEENCDDDQRVSIKVGTANKETYFKINKKCRLFKLLQTFCNHQNVDYRDMQFLFNGKRISPKHTPHSLKMKDDDQIDAMMHTDGGGSGCDRGGNNAF
ncbi:small ubiquitin-related modifier 2 isoform X2 [Cannabis sativa]|uniref:small ubiquitin-related modifier 2 isoform X2 n=1 Tax=Cannabis sativa TaxID=3483 RepID=UPI0029C9ED6A|nr:small ubiquitin-related modifier 2 isoform X2 [Cannabis sativa]